jgi:hypothetical protein
MMTALERLGEFEERVRAAVAREHAVSVGRGRARREASRALGELLAVEEAIGAGEREPDDDEVMQLRGTVRDAEAAASDDVWAARLAGARRAVEEAERERDDHGRLHFSEMASEEAALDGPVRDALQVAHEALGAAETAYALRVRRWVRIAPYGRLSAHDVPALPTQGTPDEVRGRFAAGIEPPTPRALRGQGEEAA